MSEVMRVKLEGSEGNWSVTDVESGKLLPVTALQLKLRPGEPALAVMEVLVLDADVEFVAEVREVRP